MDTVSRFLYSRAYSPATRERYSRVLREFVSEFDDSAAVTAADLLSWVERDGWGNSQRCVALAAVRAFLRWLHGDSHPALSARIRRLPSKPQRTLTIEQVQALLSLHDTSTRKGTRDLAIAALALDTGLRVSELARLLARDVDFLHASLVVQVKGGRWERAVFSERTAVYLGAWMPYREDGDPRFFQVTRDGLKTIVRRWGERLGFPLSPHDLRRTFAVLATQYGAPSRIVQLAGRWRSIEMVEWYTRGLRQDAIRPYLPLSRL